MSEEEPRIKVTDRRMFTETGELRDDFDEAESETAESESSNSPRPATPSSDPRASRTPPADAARGVEGTRRAQAPGGARGAGSGASTPPPGYEAASRGPQFLDLVAMLAEPAALFLGDAAMPGQEPMVDLERARMHIDLLALLEDKCKGNMTEQEDAVLTDLVYRLRMRYVEKKA